MADEYEDKRVGGFSINKFIAAVVIFVVIGFFTDTVVSYTQRTTTQATLETRAVVGDETNQITKENNELLKQINERLINLEKRQDNLENTGKPVK